MTEQQYRVIADRDKGDDPQWDDVEIGDRVVTTPARMVGGEVTRTSSRTTMTAASAMTVDVLRIERQVPTTDEPKTKREQIVSDLAAMGQRMFSHPSVPTREQIADVLDSLACTLAFSSRDWGANPRDAWLWGVLNGWDADEPGDESAMDEMASSHGWSDVTVGRLRGFHEVVLAVLQKEADRG